MIAIFYTEAEAITFSDKIHNFLIKNREGYNAEKWSESNKFDKEDKWMVKVPYDFEMLKEKFKIDSGIEKITKLPIDWKTIKNEPIKKIDLKQ